MLPAVSVLLPTHNNAPFLRAAVQSVLAQTFTEFELIVIDDASQDETPQILRELAAQDPRLRVLTHPSAQGIEAALNRAVSESRAPLLARMDGDDLCRPQRLERQVAALEARPEVVALGSQVQVFGDLQMRHDYPVHTAETRAYALFACPMRHPAVMMRSSAVQAVGGYRTDTPCSEDYSLWTRLLDVGELTNLPEVLLEYRRHPFSVTSTRAEQMAHSTRAVWTGQLAGLGLHPDPAELDLHGLLHLSLYQHVRVSALQATAASRWAARLLAANRRRARMDQAQLEDQLRRRLAGLHVG